MSDVRVMQQEKEHVAAKLEEIARLQTPDRHEVTDGSGGGMRMSSMTAIRDSAVVTRSNLQSPGRNLVKVYAFKAYDLLRNEEVRAPCKMTVASIESWRCVPIEGTEEEVPADKLDENGRYYPEE